MTECNLPYTYNSSLYATLTSFAQIGCNDYIDIHLEELKGMSALHVGIGTSSIYEKYYNIFSKIDGITIIKEEIEVAAYLEEQYDEQYTVFNINKYDNKKLSLLPQYDVIIDTNLKQYACCMDHWYEYFYGILSKTKKLLITHSQGYVKHSEVPPLTTKELTNLTNNTPFTVEEIISLKNSPYNCFPVIIRRCV